MKPLQTYFPFGPPIGHAELPEEMINDFNKGCDDIVKSKELSKSEDWSPQLVGQVEQEIKIPIPILDKWGRWFSSQIQTYMAGYFSQLFIPQQTILGVSREKALQTIGEMKVNVLSAWYVRSFAGDFNPIHTHTDCQLTCVGYLKVPDLSNEREQILGNAGNAGALEILGPAGSNQSAYFESDRIGLIPKVGNWYLFPANLRHVVYPFKCDGERRSFSINLNTNIFRGVIAGQ